MGLRVLTGWQLIKRAIGVTLPRQYPNLYSSFKQIQDAQFTRRPIVVFPQCTKTNGRGVLNFPIGLQIMLQAALADKFRLHACRMDYTFNYFSPYNTTDISGWRHSVGLLCQVINHATV